VLGGDRREREEEEEGWRRTRENGACGGSLRQRLAQIWKGVTGSPWRLAVTWPEGGSGPPVGERSFMVGFV
jgi:hypothetical protein